MIRRLLAVVPAVVLVGCGPAAVRSGHADAPVRNETVATSSQTTEPIARSAAPAPTASVAPSVARAVATRRAVQAGGASPRAAAENGCNRNYTPCVPDDPVDVDCAGGSGNGPSYVTGPVRVIGDDVYGLDADHNGVGCEAGAASSQAAAPKTSSRPVEAPFTTRAASPTTTALPATQPAPSSRNPTSQFAPD